MYSATAAAVVESRLREPCSAYYLASFHVRQKVSCCVAYPDDATGRVHGTRSVDVQPERRLYVVSRRQLFFCVNSAVICNIYLSSRIVKFSLFFDKLLYLFALLFCYLIGE